MKKVLIASVLLIFAVPLSVASNGELELLDSFVGAKKCGQCHSDQYEKWKEGPHSKANAQLPPQNRKDPRCIRCHGADDPMKGGVQCESCHGPGKIYARRYVMRDEVLSRLVGLQEVGLSKCGSCHTKAGPRLKDFRPEHAWKSIDHTSGAPGRKARQ